MIAQYEAMLQFYLNVCDYYAIYNTLKSDLAKMNSQ